MNDIEQQLREAEESGNEDRIAEILDEAMLEGIPHDEPTWLHYLIRNELPISAKYIIGILVNGDPDLADTDSDGRTPLELATYLGNNEVAEALREAMAK